MVKSFFRTFLVVILISQNILAGSDLKAAFCRADLEKITHGVIQDISGEIRGRVLGSFYRWRTRVHLRGYVDETVKELEKMCGVGCTQEDVEKAVVLLMTAHHTEYLVSYPGGRAYAFFLGAVALISGSMLTLKFSLPPSKMYIYEAIKDHSELIFIPLVMGAGFPIIQRLQSMSSREALKNAAIKRNVYEKFFESVFWLERSQMSPNAVEGRWSVNMALQHLKLNFNAAKIEALMGRDYDAAASAVAEAVETMCLINPEVSPFFERVQRVAHTFFGEKYVTPANREAFVEMVLNKIDYSRDGITRDKARKILENWFRAQRSPPNESGQWASP